MGDVMERASVTFIAPAPSLAPLVTAYYLTEVHHGPVTDVLHPEWANLRFLISASRPWWAQDEGAPRDIPAAALFGPTSRARTFGAQDGRCLGVGLTPLGWAVLIGDDASAAADRIGPAAATLGEAVDVLHAELARAADERGRARLLDRFLLARAARAEQPRADVALLTRLLSDPTIASVQQLADGSALSTVTLARACLRHFGFNPKLLLRRQRFLRTLATVLETRGRLSASLDPLYADQSHFNREFGMFMGETPSGYFGRVHPVLDAAARARRAALGASVQGLHVMSPS